VFEILDRAYLTRMRRERGFGVNPWRTHSRFLVSHNLLIDPAYTDPMREWLGLLLPGMVRYNGNWPHADELEKTSGGFQISRNQYEQLKALMHSGPVRVRGKIDATLGPGKLTVVHAYIRGTEHPEREVLVTGHLDHPKWSANYSEVRAAGLSGSSAPSRPGRTDTLIGWEAWRRPSG
jgi:hypothetical protein